MGRGTAVIALTATTALAFTGLAFANNINDTIEAKDPLRLEAGSATGAVGQIKVVSSNGNDGDADCNIDAGENPLVLDIVTPAGVTASPDPLSISACDAFYAVTFTASSTAVNGSATVNIVSGPAGAAPTTTTSPSRSR